MTSASSPNEPLQSAAHVLRHTHVPENVNEKHLQNLSMHDRIALMVTNNLGTMEAVYFLGALMSIWMVGQIFLRRSAFDPYPFPFLLFITNILQLLLIPLIMVGQNIQSKHAELRAEEQFKTTMTSYADLEHIISHLDAQDKELLRQSQMLVRLLQSRQTAGETTSNHAITPPDCL